MELKWKLSINCDMQVLKSTTALIKSLDTSKALSIMLNFFTKLYFSNTKILILMARMFSLTYPVVLRHQNLKWPVVYT